MTYTKLLEQNVRIPLLVPILSPKLNEISTKAS